jgi:hypothetical protein
LFLIIHLSKSWTNVWNKVLSENTNKISESAIIENNGSYWKKLTEFDFKKIYALYTVNVSRSNQNQRIEQRFELSHFAMTRKR